MDVLCRNSFRDSAVSLWGGDVSITDVFLRFVLITVLLSVTNAGAAEDGGDAHKGWQVTTGAGLFVAPAFVGAKNYSLYAVPDLRVTYDNTFFVNIKDGIGYALINQDGWRIGPVVTYTFKRSEKNGGSVFRISGDGKSALQGMGDVPGTVSPGGFAEYSLDRYKFRLHVQKGVTGHEGLVAEGKASYNGIVKFDGPPLIYSFGPHVRFGDRNYTNAYWGVSSEQSQRSGLEQYHAESGITTFGASAFALMSLTKAVSLSLIAGLDQLGPPAAHSPLVRVRGAETQVMGGLFIGYKF